MIQKSINNIVLILVLLFISVLFLIMIRHFIMVILLAGIFSAIFLPLYNKFNYWFRGKKVLSSGVTILIIFLLILLPLLSLLGAVAAQAVKISKSVSPWIQEQINQESVFDNLFQSLPYYDVIQQYEQVILQKAGELVSNLSRLLVASLSSVTLSTVHFIFLFFVFLYTMFFFLIDGKTILTKILFYLPLDNNEEQQILEKFTSVTRATIKGTFVIGLIQGTLAGLAFWIVGIDSVIFWGTIMTVLSIIPGIGTAIVWLPASILLAASGHFISAVFLFLFCAIAVGSIDNVLRPRLVGKDTKMHELYIFFGTLGGISLFGLAGFIIGPIISALFVTIWEIYGKVFQDHLPKVVLETNENVSVDDLEENQDLEPCENSQ